MTNACRAELNARILFVDDEQNILDSFRRNLRKAYSFDTALGPEEALKLVKQNGPYAVVVSDQKMPGMDGVTLLGKIRELHKDTVRIMLTGHGDMEVSIQAINEGQIFRFLTKPCPTETLKLALDDGLAFYSAITAEKEFLRCTLRGIVKVLTDIISLVNPAAYGRAQRVKRLMLRFGKALNHETPWILDLASMLSQLGVLVLPRKVMEKKIAGQPLEPEELALYEAHPAVGSNLLSNIPRMELMQRIVANQERPFHEIEDKDVPFEARMLKIVLDFESLTSAGKSQDEALEQMETHPTHYDPELFRFFGPVVYEDMGYVVKTMDVDKIKPGMVLMEDVLNKRGMRLVATNTEISESLLIRLRNFKGMYAIVDRLKVKVPLDTTPDPG